MRRLFLSSLLAAAALFAKEPFPDPSVDQAPAKGRQKAVFAGGCFWCTEAVFENLKGVADVVSGYSGGDASSAHYKVVSEGRTEHAEAIEITFDPAIISFGTLLKVFFSVAHDPTTLNRQGPDWGKQYRSAVFYLNDEQKKITEAYVAQLNAARVFGKSAIVTQVVPLKAFYPAEGYHQDFVRNNPIHPYVMANSSPKLAKLKNQYPALYVKKK